MLCAMPTQPVWHDSVVAGGQVIIGSRGHRHCKIPQTIRRSRSDRRLRLWQRGYLEASPELAVKLGYIGSDLEARNGISKRCLPAATSHSERGAISAQSRLDLKETGRQSATAPVAAIPTNAGE